jgi:hypothetical protein
MVMSLAENIGIPVKVGLDPKAQEIAEKSILLANKLLIVMSVLTVSGIVALLYKKAKK